MRSWRTRVTLLFAVALAAQAQEPQGNDPQLECDDEECRSEEGLLFRLRTRSYDDRVTHGLSNRSSSDELQPDRRAAIEMEPPGKAVIGGRFSLALPGGGVIWATEDPSPGIPTLAASAPAFAPFEAGQITAPQRFYVRTNYPAFIERLEITIYQATDGDLISPLATVPVPVAAVSYADWSGALPPVHRLGPGDELVYVLRAYGKDGNFDETLPRTLQLVTQQEAEQGRKRLRDSAKGTLPGAFSAEEAQERSLLASVFTENRLNKQNIMVRGSRVRIQGRDLPPDRQLTIDGVSYPVDAERKFVAEYLQPVGHRDFTIGLEGGGQEQVSEVLSVDVTGRYLFAVGLADLTLSTNSIGGSTAPFAGDPRLDDDMLYDGRLAFYLKTRLRARYLLTAQLDTTERDLRDLFDDFGAAQPDDVFRRLDPDQYYPTYGDDSTTYRDVDTQGRFYLRMDWDRNQALWGNYSTGITGTEYAQYTRSLYGAALDWHSAQNNAWGDAGTDLRVFGSQAQTAPGHTEFTGSGGSVYYLKHTDIVPGSDKVVIEVRDLTTGRVENRIELRRGADYELDDLQGRIILTRPLGQVTRLNSPTLTRDAPLDGMEQRLLVDYEWVPSSFSTDEITAGVRAKHWFGEHVGVGVTYVDENRSGDDYTMLGGDVTFQAGKGTYIKVEHAETQASSTPIYFSSNGGMSFDALNQLSSLRGNADAVETRANLHELGWTQQDWTTAMWWRRVQDGYSVPRFDRASETEDYGTEVAGHISERLGMYARMSHIQRGDAALNQVQLTGDWRYSDRESWSMELRAVEEDRSGPGDSATGTLSAVRYQRRIGSALDLYGIGQLTLSNDHQDYGDNDALTLGGRYLLGDTSNVGAELVFGERGSAAQVGAEVQVSPNQTIYGSYTLSTDTTEYDSLFDDNRRNNATFGQRWRISDQVSQFSESRYLRSPDGAGLAHTFGMDFFPARGWNVGFTLEDDSLRNFTGSDVDRSAIGVHGGLTTPFTEWQSKLEWREEAGAERRRQWVTTNRLTQRLNDSWRLALRLNLADTFDRVTATQAGRVIEGNVGFAWRPWKTTRWSAFGRYSYLYDLAPVSQMGARPYDQRTQVLSLEGVYKPARRWEFAGRFAWREGEVRAGRGEGAWFDSAAFFSAAQLRFDMQMQWHAMAEYRRLDVRNGGARQGMLAGADRDVAHNLRIGAGYNFTNFSDDLTDFGYDQKGWFLNLVGRY